MTIENVSLYVISAAVLLWMIPMFRWRTFPRAIWAWNVELALWIIMLGRDAWFREWGWWVVGDVSILTLVALGWFGSHMAYGDWKSAQVASAPEGDE